VHGLDLVSLGLKMVPVGEPVKHHGNVVVDGGRFENRSSCRKMMREIPTDMDSHQAATCHLTCQRECES
jgi:hypothetical protein